jgi:hypothetical protein
MLRLRSAFLRAGVQLVIVMSIVTGLIVVASTPVNAASAHKPFEALREHGGGLVRPDRPGAAQTEITGTITPDGTPVSKTISTAGDTIRLDFSELQGRYISLSISGNFYTYTKVRIFDNTTGAQLVSTTWGSGFVDKTLLPPGQPSVMRSYRITVTPLSSVPTGSGTFRLWEVPDDNAGTIAIDGAGETLTISTPGQNAYRTFDGQKDQFVFLKIGSGFTYYTKVKICKGQPPCASASTIATVNFGQTYIDRLQLPATDTYTIYLDPSGLSPGETGSTVFQLYSVPDDETGNIEIGGASQVSRVTRYGERSERLFYGFPGQQVTLTLQNVSIYYYTPIRILDPNGVSIRRRTPELEGRYRQVSRHQGPTRSGWIRRAHSQVASPSL